MNAAKTNKNLSTIAIIAIILLLILNGVLLYDRASKDQNIQQLEKDLVEVRHLQNELEREYYEAISELDEMRTDNEELNTLIEAQKDELGRQRDKISRLIYENRNLEGAREELDKLKVLADGYLEEIDRLYEENQELAEAKTRLEMEKEKLTEEIATERKATDELMSLQTSLVEEKEILDGELNKMTRKVERASVVEVQNIEVEGFRIASSGKERKRRKADNIDMLKICFQTTANEIVEFGDEAFFIRIISPAGETLALENLGSGVIEEMEENSQIRFTQMKTVPYDSSVKEVCTSWNPGISFPSGNYEVEVYNKGFLAGSGQFELR